MGASLKATYTVQNKDKYVGVVEPRCRSTWELAFCRFCDENPSILNWAYEPLKILYKHPFKNNKYTVYVPDFLVVYADKNGASHAELIEIKPAKETHLSEAKSKRDIFRLAINTAKWQAAAEYCKKNGMFFRILTEDQIFNRARKK